LRAAAGRRCWGEGRPGTSSFFAGEIAPEWNSEQPLLRQLDRFFDEAVSRFATQGLDQRHPQQ
jgi:hypothetical protein